MEGTERTRDQAVTHAKERMLTLALTALLRPHMCPINVKALPENSYAAEFKVKGRDDLRERDILNVPSVLNSTLRGRRPRGGKRFSVTTHREAISAANCWTAQGNEIRQSKL